jgi:phosphate-selective porin
MRAIFSIVSGFILLICMATAAMAGGASTGDALVDVLHQKGVIDDAQYNDLKKAKAEGGEQAAQKRLLDVLHAKGLLDDAQYKTLSEQADQEARAQAATAEAPQAPSAPQATAAGAKPETAAAGGAERPFDKTLTSLEEGFARLGGDTVKLKLSGYLQAGWLNDDAGFSVTVPPTTGRTLGVDNQFFVRRARLNFNGQVLQKTGFRISIETSDMNGKILRDAYVFADYIPYARVTVGQFKDPYGVEGVECICENPTINRSFATNFIADPTLRDIGAMLSGKYTTTVAGLPLGAGYAVALTNGTGKNAVDDNDNKDVSGRAWLNPFLPGLTVGGSWYNGKTNTVSNFTTGATTDKVKMDWDRWGADAEYRPPYVNGLLLRGEVLWARKYYPFLGHFTTTGDVTATIPSSAIPAGWTFNRQAHSFGWYTLAAYRVDGLQGFWRYMNGIEPLVRYDFLDEDTALPDTSRNRVTLGVNYYFNKYARMMANWEIIHADGSLRTRSLETIDTKGHHLFTTLLQVKF